MLKVCSILVTRIALAACTVAVSACGLKGPLKLPTDEASRGRATLVESLMPEVLRTPPVPPSAPPPPVTAPLTPESVSK